MASIHFKCGKSGKKTYYVVVSHLGKHKWIRAGSLKDAKILEREIELMAESERFEKLGIAHREKRIKDFFQEFLDQAKLRLSPNSVKRYKAALNAFLAFLELYHSSVRYLSQITPDVIEDYQRKRLESVELKIAADGEKPGNHKEKRLPLPQTVNYEVGVLRTAFLRAYDRDLIPKVPTRKVRFLKPRPKREVKILGPEDCKLLLKTAREMAKQHVRMKVYADAFTFLLNTGLRSGELCNLTWDDIDLETGLIRIRPKEGWTPKSYSREFFLNEGCLKLLGKVSDRQGLVFKEKSGRGLDSDGLRKALIKVAKQAGLQITRVHDLRHTFSSLLQMKGVDQGTVATILGHKDLTTTRIYTHQTAEHLKKSIEKVGVG